MQIYPKAVRDLIEEFSKLPTIGPKTAERLVLHLLQRPTAELQRAGQLLANLQNAIKRCEHCQNWAETDPCSICADRGRNHSILCIVAKPQDLTAMERTRIYDGVYYVLNFSNFEESLREENFNKLILKIKNEKPKEIILALNPDLEGETISLALIKQLKPLAIKLTRLARGLPNGADVEYADEMTLSNALRGRKEVN